MHPKLPLIIFLFQSLIFSTGKAQLPFYEFEATIAHAKSADDLASLTVGDLWLVRNYIFAKHGYHFKNPKLNSYFQEAFEFICDNPNAHNLLTADEVKMVALLRQVETEKKLTLQTVTIRRDTFSLRNHQLVNKGEAISSSPEYHYISSDFLENGLHLIQISSAYDIGDLGCCGERGVKNKVVKQYLYYPLGQKLLEIPDPITQDRYIEEIFKHQFIFVFNHIFSGAHSLEIFTLDGFQKLGELDEIEGMEIKEEEVEIWEFMDKKTEFPYKYRRKWIFRDGVLKRTDIVEKVEAAWYFAG